jgi:hypothetical protein
MRLMTLPLKISVLFRACVTQLTRKTHTHTHTHTQLHTDIPCLLVSHSVLHYKMVIYKQAVKEKRNGRGCFLLATSATVRISR